MLAPLTIFFVARAISGVMLAVGANRQAALDDASGGYKVTVPTPESPGYLGVVTNWDGQWYRAIAEHGYPAALPQVDGDVVPNEWAFTPGYPLTVRAVMFLARIDFPLAATIVSLVCGATAMVVSTAWCANDSTITRLRRWCSRSASFPRPRCSRSPTRSPLPFSS